MKSNQHRCFLGSCLLVLTCGLAQAGDLTASFLKVNNSYPSLQLYSSSSSYPVDMNFNAQDDGTTAYLLLDQNTTKNASFRWRTKITGYDTPTLMNLSGGGGVNGHALLQLYQVNSGAISEQNENVRLNTSGYSWFTGGSVGIGTKTPDATLDVENSYSPSLRLTHPDAPFTTYVHPYPSSSGQYLFISADSSSYPVNFVWRTPISGSSGSSANYMMQLSGGGPNSLNPSVSIFKADGSEKIKLNSNGDSYVAGGNLGIGTTSPSTLLDVGGVTRSQRYREGFYATSVSMALTTTNSTVNFTGASLTCTLPSASTIGSGTRFTVKCSNASGLTIATTSSQTIDSTTPVNLTSGQSRTYISDGSNWWIVEGYL